MLIFLFSICFFVSGSCFAQTSQPQELLQAANSTVDQAFNSVLSAEKAGANVTNLIDELNVANNLLAQADNAYRTGDNSTAANYALPAFEKAEDVNAAAQTAKTTGLASNAFTFWISFGLTVINIVLFALILLLVWRWLKKRYVKSLSNARPQVIN